ncbi:MAG: serine hydrolase [Gemmatimonadota bacterium]|nr:serine hydrolase [Gemmatimonadota bacterium]
MHRRRVGRLVVTACGVPLVAGTVACAGERGSGAGAGEVGRASSALYVPGPGDDWERVDPAEAGFDPGALAAAIDWALAHETSMPTDPGQYLRDRFAGQRWQEIVGPTRERGGVNGVLLVGGRIVAEWGDTDRADMTFSVTKSYLSTVVGLAWDDGLIPDLDAPVRELIRDGGFDSPHNARITWRHHLRQLSEWEGTLFGKPDQADRRRGVDRELREPGTFWEYNDVRVNRLALSALRLFGRPLPDVLRERIMDPIGASSTWEWHGYETSWVEVGGDSVQSVSGGGHWGGGLFISTRDHARFGLLMSRRGAWGDRQLVSEGWIEEALTPSLQPNYGFMWWLNTDRAQFPNAPETSYFALGAGSTSTIWVDPDHDLVLVSRWIDGPDVDELIGRILAARLDDASGLAVDFRPSTEKVFPDDPLSPARPDHVVEIALARNEVEGVQVALRASSDLPAVEVSIDSLVGPNGTRIAEEDIEIRPVGYVNLERTVEPDSRTGWHPDPLLPGQVFPVEAGVTRSVLVSVRADTATPPGDYAGTLTISGVAEPIEHRVVVRVWDITLPLIPRFRTASFADWGVLDRMWPADLGFEALDETERMDRMLRLADLAFDYRLPPTAFLANGLRSPSRGGDGTTVAGFPTHRRDAGGEAVFDAARTDRLLDFLLARGANHLFIALTGNVWRPPERARERQKALVAYLAEYVEHLRSRGLLDLAYVYNIDEPWGEDVISARRTYTLVKETVGPDVRVMQNTNQTDRRVVSDFLGFFDVLDINLGFHDTTGVAPLRERQPERLSEVWWNVNMWPASHPNLFLEYPLTDARIIGPMSFAYGVDGFEYWDLFSGAAGGSFHPLARDESRVRWDVGERSLDGTLVYPAANGDIYPSLRLAALRDGFEDYELLALLAEAAPGHPLLAVPIVAGIDEFTRDPREIADFRRRVAEALLSS